MERTSAKNRSPETSQPVLKSLLLSQSFRLGSVQVHYYGIILAAAIVAGFGVALARAKKAGFDRSFLEDLGFWLIIFGIIGARAYYVIFYPQFFRGDFLEIFRIWHGGQAIYGALIGGALTVWYFARKYKINFWRITDFLVFALPLGQAIGRLGNYFNYEAFGKPTNLPWKIFIPQNFRPAGYEQYQFFQPAFAYEALASLALFALMLGIEKYFEKNPGKTWVQRLNQPGIFTAIYIIGYSIARFFVEGIRLDSAYLSGFRVDQITALFLIVLTSAILVYRYAAQISHRSIDRN